MQMPGCSNNTASDPFRNGSSSPSSDPFPPVCPLNSSSPSSSSSLPAGESTRLCHRSVLLLEPLAEPLGALEELVDAAHDAALLLGEQRLGSEVGDAVGEAALDKVGVHLWRISALAVFDGVGVFLSPSCFWVLVWWAGTYVHEVLHLLALHAALQLALLGGVQSVARVELVKLFEDLCLLDLIPSPLEQDTRGVSMGARGLRWW